MANDSTGYLDHEDLAVINKIGGSVTDVIDATESECDLTGLAPYPFKADVEARDSSCYIAQGATGVKLHATAARNFRIAKDAGITIHVTGAHDAFLTLERAGSDTGTLVVTRIDREKGV